MTPPLNGKPPPAKKALGQNFLVDRHILNRIIGAAEVSEDDYVVEVGPGRGFLSRALAERAGHLVAVELDDILADRLMESLDERTNVTVVKGDGRRVDIGSLVPSDREYKLVANLPYYAASPIVRRFLEAEHKPSLMVFLIQREVAQSMVAPQGRMGLLSVAVQLYGRPRIVCSVPPRAFRPAPKVTSALVHIDVYPRPALNMGSTRDFFTVVRAGFSAPRKQLRNSLRRGLDIPSEAVEAALARAGVEPTRRAQTLSLVEWGGLYEAFREMSGVSWCRYADA